MKVSLNFGLLMTILVFAVSTIAIVSCDSDMVDETSNKTTINLTEKNGNEISAEREFAKILSIAAAKNAVLRTFFKQEALKQFDKDYDVFYPYVKDSLLERGKSLRDILVEYSSEEEISFIENNAPLLTIMIPDLESFNAFSINNWDPSQDLIATTFVSGNENSDFFAEGDSLLSLPSGCLPNFPFMVVKSNERMKVVEGSSSTRTENLHYDFIDPAFDGTKENQTRSSYYTEKNNESAPEEKPYLKKGQLDSRCIEAYSLFKNSNTLLDREYIYYNLSPKNPTNGVFNSHIREKLYMFKVDPTKYNELVDKDSDSKSVDPLLIEYKNAKLYKKTHPSTEQIAKDLWQDGAFEFVFQSYKGGTGLVESKSISIKGSDLFYIDQFQVRYEHHTAFRHSKWWYWAEPKDLKGKWVDVSDKDIYLTDTWDLANSPLSYYIKVSEKDNGATRTISDTYTASYISKRDGGASGELKNEDFNIKLNLGFSYQSTVQKEHKITIQYKDEDEDLGSVSLNFRDPVIISDAYATSKGYQMYSLNTGSIDIVLVPKSLR